MTQTRTANEQYLLLQAQHRVPEYRDRQKIIDALLIDAIQTADLIKTLTD